MNQRQPQEIKTYSQSGDIFDNSYYDTAILATATTQYGLFDTPISATKSKALTNMTDPGQFPTGKQFQIREIGIRISDQRAAPAALKTGLDLNILFATLAKATLTFNIIGKQDLGEWPVDELLGLTNFATTPLVAANNDNAGLITYAAQWKKLKYPINLDQRVRFSIPLTFYGVTALPANVVDFGVEIIIKGTEQRRK